MQLAVESVWDYPRPPRLEPVDLPIVVKVGDHTIVETRQALRILETSHPPTYYLPRADIAMELLRPNSHTTFCEFKGRANYFDIILEGVELGRAAWTYERPTGDYLQIADHLSFYATKDVVCSVGDEPVIPQDGNFYGGWITRNLKGPFKGAPGTLHW